MISFGAGGGSNRAKQLPSSVWDVQGPYLQALYGGALGLAGQQLGQGRMPGIGQRPGLPQSQGISRGRAPFGPAGPGGWQGGGGMGGDVGTPQLPAGGAMSPIGMASQDWTNQLLGTGGATPWIASNPYLSQQIGGLGQDIGNFYNQQILPGINQQASYAGGTGGARGQIAGGLAAQAALQQFQQGATGLRSSAYDTGIGNLNNLYNLGMAPWAAQWAPLQGLMQVLGSPTVLSGGGTSGGWNANVRGSFLDFGGGNCFIAREVFGEDNPEWILFFQWKETKAPLWFRNGYDRYSKAIASWLRDKPWLKTILRLWMRWVS